MIYVSVAVLKINNDLERIGDIVNIADRGLRLAASVTPATAPDAEMGSIAREMLSSSLDALMELDVAQAKVAIACDDEVDSMRRSLTT